MENKKSSGILLGYAFFDVLLNHNLRGQSYKRQSKFSENFIRFRNLQAFFGVENDIIL